MTRSKKFEKVKSYFIFDNLMLLRGWLLLLLLLLVLHSPLNLKVNIVWQCVVGWKTAGNQNNSYFK
jgi:hypothetical protein